MFPASVWTLLGSAFLVSCYPKCKNVDCNTGICVEGRCVCDKGWQGQFCEIRQTSKFNGNYDVLESCNTGTFSYVITISESDSVIPELELSNFYNFSSQGITAKVFAEVDFDGITFDISSQSVGGLAVSGSGSINDTTGTITLNYQVANDICNSVLTPR